MNYKQIRIDEVTANRIEFIKLYNELENWSETHIDGPYWSDDERANFDPKKNGLYEIFLNCMSSFDRQVQAIKDEKPADYTTLGD